MEPCNARRSGKKSCTDLIIESGIRRLVYGADDPEDYIKINGIRSLRESGIKVVKMKSLEKSCRKLVPNSYERKIRFALNRAVYNAIKWTR
jgi:diaminohydroxyphosphoribosylaminopyrimidine deaminase/5-amino-6-(5-phosphoribosylamino)uracil reductase